MDLLDVNLVQHIKRAIESSPHSCSASGADMSFMRVSGILQVWLNPATGVRESADASEILFSPTDMVRLGQGQDHE